MTETMEASADPENEATIDPVAVIRLIRQLLPDNCELSSESHGHDTIEEQTSRASDQEVAGCMLWDLSSIREAAVIMAENYICDILPVMIEHGSDRLAEISTGILGNLACHDVLIPQLLTAALRQAVLGDALWRDDPACLIEVCKLLTSLVPANGAQEWLQDLLQAKTLERIIWMLENTLNNSLFERACQLLSQVASTGAAVVSRIIKQPFISVLCNSLQQSAQQLAAPERASSEWDSPRAPTDDDTFPGTLAIQAAFDVLEAIAEDPGGAAALQQDQQLVASMLLVLQSCAHVSVRGRAAALMAELDAEALYKSFAQDAAAMDKLLSLVVTSSSDEDYGEACWALLAAVTRFMLTAISPQPVLWEVTLRAEELVAAAEQLVDMEPGMAASQRVAYTLRQLAALVDNCGPMPAQGCAVLAECSPQMGSVPSRLHERSEAQDKGQEPESAHSQEQRHGQQQSDQEDKAEVEHLCNIKAMLHAAAEQVLQMQSLNETRVSERTS